MDVDLPLIFICEPEGAIRCNDHDWIEDTPEEHAAKVHGVTDQRDILVVHSDDI